MRKEDRDEVIRKATENMERLFCKKGGCLKFAGMRRIDDGGIWKLLDFLLLPSRDTSTCLLRGIWIDVHVAVDWEHLVIVERNADDKALMDDVIGKMENGYYIEI